MIKQDHASSNVSQQGVLGARGKDLPVFEGAKRVINHWNRMQGTLYHLKCKSGLDVYLTGLFYLTPKYRNPWVRFSGLCYAGVRLDDDTGPFWLYKLGSMNHGEANSVLGSWQSLWRQLGIGRQLVHCGVLLPHTVPKLWCGTGTSSVGK